MSPFATQAEIARKLGLARSTVSAALNPNSKVKLHDQTRKRILQATRRFSYHPNRYAQVVRQGRSGVVGMIHFGGLLQVAVERAFYAAKAIHGAGLQLMACDAAWFDGGLQAVCSAMLDAKVEGVLVAGLNHPASVVELGALKKARIPLVTLSGNEMPGVPQVRCDARQGMRDLANDLLKSGYRRLVHLTFPLGTAENTYAWGGVERRKGFQEAIESAGGHLLPEESFSEKSNRPAGIVFSENAVSEPFDPHGPGKKGMQALLKQSILPDVVLCNNDDWAIGAISAIAEAGLSIPKDVAVAGFDDTALGRYGAIPLTTVRQPSEEMAQMAVAMLLQRIQKKTFPASNRLVKLPCQLILRQSTHKARVSQMISTP